MRRTGRPRRGWTERVTAVERRLRDGRPSVRGAGAGAPAVLALIETPYRSVEDVRRGLTALEREFAARGDDRAVFLTVYARTTSAVAARIERCEFEDPDWVADYLVAFANRYREAVRDHERGALSGLADAWRLAFDSAAAPDSLAIQDALLGVNAHINYDLAFALAEVGIDGDRDARYADHCAVTDTLREIVDDIQRLLATEYAPGLARVDDALGRVDERVAVRTIDECRASAWRNAVGLASRFRARRWLARHVTALTATGAAYVLLSSHASDTVQGGLGEFEAAGAGESRTMTDDEP